MRITAEEIKSEESLDEALDLAEVQRRYLSEETFRLFYLPQSLLTCSNYTLPGLLSPFLALLRVDVEMIQAFLESFYRSEKFVEFTIDFLVG